jgi:hypothetical protein
MFAFYFLALKIDPFAARLVVRYSFFPSESQCHPHRPPVLITGHSNNESRSVNDPCFVVVLIAVFSHLSFQERAKMKWLELETNFRTVSFSSALDFFTDETPSFVCV